MCISVSLNFSYDIDKMLIGYNLRRCVIRFNTYNYQESTRVSNNIQIMSQCHFWHAMNVPLILHLELHKPLSYVIYVYLRYISHYSQVSRLGNSDCLGYYDF